MARIKIEIITPVHIGNGVKLQNQSDFLYFAEENIIAIIDEAKILKIIGENNINQWLNIIERGGNFLDFLARWKKPLKSNDVAKRQIKFVGKEIPRAQFLFEQLHNGIGVPCIPGSSLKGAIRTAVLSYLISEKSDFVKLKSNLGSEKNEFFNFNDKKLQKYFIGEDPNHDILRFLRIGDAHFQNTCSLILKTANLRKEGWQFAPIIQWIECINKDNSTNIEIFFADEVISSERMNFKQVGTKKDILSLMKNKHIDIDKAKQVLSTNTIFNIINQHTLRLFTKEINFINKQKESDIVEDYLENLISLKKIAESCKEGECVLRVGFSTHYFFITGGWQDEFMNPSDYEELKTSLRKKPFYKDFPFPKTRRFTPEGVPIGFVKLSLLKEEAEEYENIKSKLFISTAFPKESVIPTPIGPAEAPQLAKPSYFTGKLKVGDIVEAELVGVDPLNPKIKIFRLFLFEPGKEQEVKLSYFADLPIGLKAQVKITNIQKDKVISIQFVKALK